MFEPSVAAPNERELSVGPGRTSTSCPLEAAKDVL